MQKLSGTFITIEGGEGVGKSLFIENLKNYFAQNKPQMNVEFTREPGGTPVAMKIRELFNAPPLHDPLTIESEFLLVSAARAQHVKNKIRPLLDQGVWVISDRFADSSRVYQGIVGKLPSEFIEYLISATTYEIEPDVTFLLDCPIEIAQKRIQARGKIIESEQGAARYDDASVELHSKIRNGFLQLAKTYSSRFKVLDASLAPEDVLKQAIVHLKMIDLLTECK